MQNWLIIYVEVWWKVDKKAMIRNRYNRIPHPALNTKQERDTYGNKIKTAQVKSQGDSSFPTNGLKATLINWTVSQRQIEGGRTLPIRINHNRSIALERPALDYWRANRSTNGTLKLPRWFWWRHTGRAHIQRFYLLPIYDFRMNYYWTCVFYDNKIMLFSKLSCPLALIFWKKKWRRLWRQKLRTTLNTFPQVHFSFILGRNLDCFISSILMGALRICLSEIKSKKIKWNVCGLL